MTQLNAEAMAGLSADELLDMPSSEVEVRSFILAPAGVYTGTVKTELKTEENGVRINFEVTLSGCLEVIEGSKGETAEEIEAKGESAFPETIRFSYTTSMPSSMVSLNTDWQEVAFEKAGNDELSLREIIETMDGADIQFTHTYYKKNAGKADEKIYGNIKDITLLTV